MRDIASCFGEYATQIVSDASCSTYTNTSSCISPNLTPSVQNAVTCLYKTILSNQKHLLFTATWTKNITSQGLTIHYNNHPLIKLNTSSRFFRKKKGTKSVESENIKFDLYWDLSEAKYSSGPEPINGYYILIMVDSELALVLGKTAEEAVSRKLKNGTKTAKSSLVSRKEHFSGNTLYSTRAKFCEKGVEHDILIRCGVGNEGLKSPILSVIIDKKTVHQVKRLQWNFRGYHAIFIDGLMVDLMWDVHDWFFRPPPLPSSSSSSSSSSGSAVFMFRTRSGMETSLWLEGREEEKEKGQFSLLIYACKTP